MNTLRLWNQIILASDMSSESVNESVSSRSSGKPGVIFGKEYCLPDEREFRLDRKKVTKEEYIMTVKDEEGKINWEVKMYNPLVEDNKFTVQDNEGKIIMTLQESVLPRKRIWLPSVVRPRLKVYKGDSTDKKDFLFTVRRPRMLWKCDVEVFLPSTKEEDGGFDFEVVPEWGNADFVVQNKGGDILAEGHEGRGWFQDHSYNVTVSPNVDYAFMVALALMFYEMHTGGARSVLYDPEEGFAP